MTPYFEALRLVTEQAKPLPLKNISLYEALNFVLANDLYAPLNQPPFSRSPLDGFTFNAADTELASTEKAVCLSVVGSIPAGEVCDTPIKSGCAMRIFTGAMLPPLANAVVAQEDVFQEEKKILITKVFQPEENVVRAGEDISKGDLILKKGALLGPAELGILASQGISRLSVYSKPVVAVLSSGSELAELEETLQPGQIYNSNRYTLQALVARLGGKSIYCGRMSDDLVTLTEAIATAILASDLLVITGGVSVGEHDLVPAAVAQAGAEQLFHRVDMRPGTPILAARSEEKIIFGLSGNPAACLVGFLQFVLPVFNIIRGLKDWQHQWVEALLTKPFFKDSKQNRFLSARTVYKDGAFLTEPSELQRPGILSSFAGVNSLIFIPTGSKQLSIGESVRVQLFPELASMMFC